MLSLPIVTVPTLLQHLNSSLQTLIAASLADRQVLRVTGTLGAFPKSNYPTFYGVKLSNAGMTILMDVPRTLIQSHNLRGGEDVTVTGAIIVKTNPQLGNLDIRIQVSDIFVNASNAATTRSNDLATISTLKQSGLRRNAFPLATRPRLTVISSKSGNAQVDNDFFLELGEAANRLDITHVRTNILSPNDIRDAICTSECDILVIIRGGGDADQFSVFDNIELLAAFAKHPAYRVIGLGHAGNATIMDLSADFCANTPTQAGGHIRDCLMHQSKLADKLDAQNRLLVDQLKQREDQIACLLTTLGSRSHVRTLSLKTRISIAFALSIVLLMIGYLYKFA